MIAKKENATTVKELKKYLEQLPEDATVIVSAWFDNGRRFYRTHIPLGDPLIIEEDRSGVECVVIGAFDDCIAETVYENVKKPRPKGK